MSSTFSRRTLFALGEAGDVDKPGALLDPGMIIARQIATGRFSKIRVIFVTRACCPGAAQSVKMIFLRETG